MAPTDADLERLADHFVAKHLGPFHNHGNDVAADWLRGVILTVIADTQLVLNGTLTVDDYAPVADA